MGDENKRGIGEGACHVFEHLSLRFGIERGSCFIEQVDGGFFQ